ncbi:MAG: PEP-CTERM sorting domain-containing protein [Alphaproteobacteria bacterium]|nr:PEP-CTERM sorting domain-containing protein [Alphaproteobacteria bacterium]
MKKLILLLALISNFSFISASEVWVGVGYDVKAYDFNGNYLSSFTAGSQDIKAMEVIGNEVWIGVGYDVKAYGFNGNYLSSFTVGSQDIKAMEMIPEPATMILFGLGSLILRKRRVARAIV